MEWETLDFANADAVISESRSAVSALERLDKQMLAASGGGGGASNGTSRKLRDAVDTLVAAIERRVEAIQRFYNDNDLNPKASQFEMCRLMLKRALMQHTINASGGVLGVEGAAAPVTPVPSRASADVAASAAAASGLSSGVSGSFARTSSQVRNSAHSSFAVDTPQQHSFAGQRGPADRTTSVSVGAASSIVAPPSQQGSRMVTLKVILTREEYEEVLRRKGILS